jgi:DNA-directed RNA polymerase specialized sigma24 family protein
MKHTSEQNHNPNSAASLSSDRSPLSAGALLPIDLFADFVRGLFLLDSDLRDVVSLRYLGATYREIGEQLGISTQLAEMRHKRALRDWPALCDLFPEKVARQSRRHSNKH